MNDMPPWPEKPPKGAIMSERLAYRGRKIAALRARNAQLVALAESLLVEPDDLCRHRECVHCGWYVQAQELIEACKEPT